MTIAAGMQPNAKDRKLLDTLLQLISSCSARVGRELEGARYSPSTLAQDQLQKLERTAAGLMVLGLVARIVLLRPPAGEQSPIRCARSQNIGLITKNPLPIIEKEEHANASGRLEVLLSDLLLFPPASQGGGAPASSPTSSPSSFSPFCWPLLADLRLSPERLDARNRGIGGSDANVIFSGDDERIHRLWQEKRGEAEPEDLSGRLSVVLGCWTEDFNRQWYEKVSGNRVIDAGKALACTQYRWRKCTLDGVVEGSGAIFEAKHTNAFVKPEEVLERYMPQLQHNMAVARADRAVLSVIFGNARYEMFEVAADWLYQLDLLEAEKAFWSAVLSGEPPVAIPPPHAPRPVATRELSFEGNNAWASAAANWLETSKAARTHASATRTIKELLEDDVRRAFGHGIEAKRSKAGAVTIKELK